MMILILYQIQVIVLVVVLFGSCDMYKLHNHITHSKMVFIAYARKQSSSSSSSSSQKGYFKLPVDNFIKTEPDGWSDFDLKGKSNSTKPISY